MFDLLSGTPTHEQSGSDITICDDSEGGVHVKGLTMHACTNEEDALNHVFEGETNRTISEHQLNQTSSRSHCIFTIYVECKSRVESSEKVVSSKLNLVDLAGSERTKKSGSEGVILKEANFINKSLSFLEQVVIASCDKSREFIPYRQSKLTNLLKDSIGGNSKTNMIANIWPEPAHLEETIGTLKFGTRMMKVTNEAVVNIHLDSSQLVKKYEREIRELKQELAMHDTLANRGRITYDNYTPEQQYEVQKLAEQYLKGEKEDIEEITSLRQVRELFLQFRHCYKKLEKKVQETIGIENKPAAEAGETKEKETEKEKEAPESKGVGETEETAAGFGIGKALKESKPKQPVDVANKAKRPEDEEANEEEENPDNPEEEKKEGQEEIPGSEIKTKKEKKVEVLDRQTVFFL
jgi:kinesin family protein 6/9